MLTVCALSLAIGGAIAHASADSADVTVLLRKAESGDARAAFVLGMRYAGPDDSSRDDVEAVRWLRQAAGQGLAEAQYNLGIMYAAGRGVPRDPGQAADWYRQAAEQGLARAQYNLGAQYAVGDGVPRDEKRAASWFQRAALQGVPEAAYNLGVLYDLGRGVEPDVATAMQWYERAAEGGYHPAASRLAALRAANPSIPATLPAPSSTPTSTSGVELPAAQASPAVAAEVATPGAEPPGTAMAMVREAHVSAAVGSSANPWLAELDPAHYTLQLLSHTDEASVRRYLDEHFADGSARYFAFELEGKTWFSVVYGDYASHSQAKAAGEALAARLPGPQPWVRKVAIIQKAAIR